MKVNNIVLSVSVQMMAKLAAELCVRREENGFVGFQKPPDFYIEEAAKVAVDAGIALLGEIRARPQHQIADEEPSHAAQISRPS